MAPGVIPPPDYGVVRTGAGSTRTSQQEHSLSDAQAFNKVTFGSQEGLLFESDKLHDNYAVGGAGKIFTAVSVVEYMHPGCLANSKLLISNSFVAPRVPAIPLVTKHVLFREATALVRIGIKQINQVAYILCLGRMRTKLSTPRSWK